MLGELSHACAADRAAPGKLGLLGGYRRLVEARTGIFISEHGMDRPLNPLLCFACAVLVGYHKELLQ